MDKLVRSSMDKIFRWFEDNLFKNELDHSRSLNLVLEFADWIDSDSGKDAIATEFGEDKTQEISEEYSKGINKYLETVK